MKIIKHLFPRLSLTSRSCPSQSRPPPPPLRKKALLIGIRRVRQDSVEIPQENGERPAEEDVHIAPKRKKKKEKAAAQKVGAEEPGALKEQAVLKGPHRDVLDMEQILISAL